MSTPPAATPDPKQPSYEALTSLYETAKAAQSNPANTPAAQDLAFDVMTTTSAQLDALDQAVFTGNTVQLQAAVTNMSPGMSQLNALRTKIAALGNDLKESTAIISGIDTAFGELSALGV